MCITCWTAYILITLNTKQNMKYIWTTVQSGIACETSLWCFQSVLLYSWEERHAVYIQNIRHCKIFDVVDEWWQYTKIWRYDTQGAMPWFRKSVTGSSPHRPRFDPSPLCLGFVLDSTAVGQVFLQGQCSLDSPSPNCSRLFFFWANALLPRSLLYLVQNLAKVHISVHTTVFWKYFTAF